MYPIHHSFECSLLEDLLDEVKEFLKRVSLQTVYQVVHAIVDRLRSLQTELFKRKNSDQLSSSDGGDVTAHDAAAVDVDNPSTICATAAYDVVKKAHECFEGEVLFLLDELIELLAGFGVKTNVSCRQISRKSQKGNQKMEIVLEGGSASKTSTATSSGKKRVRDEEETEEKNAEDEEDTAGGVDDNVVMIGMDDIFENILINFENGWRQP